MPRLLIENPFAQLPPAEDNEGCNKTGQRGQRTRPPGQKEKEAREVGAEQKEPGEVIGQGLPKLQEGTQVRMQNPHTKR